MTFLDTSMYKLDILVEPHKINVNNNIFESVGILK